ncbi:MAG: outer membrane beta-barrel protein [Bacteroidales bacterium]|nr:outer membrane beta-barrel protein [Bacteroidales bacterium]
MRRFFFAIAAAFLSSFSLCAQNLSGVVLDENGSPMEFVTIALISLPDSTIVGGGMTGADGSFEIERAGNATHVQVAMIGYQTVDLPVSAFMQPVTIVLEPDSRMLESAVVSAHLPRTEIQGDAVVTNITGSVLEHTGNAFDVLGKIPGMINNGGSLEVIGRGAPVYYINGRKVTDSSELRNLMSEDIRSIDVVSNPGALYGGDVSAVVRIRTVKRQGDGLSFALTSQAKQHVYNCDDFEPSWSVLDLNYRTKGVDFFGKLVYWNQRNYQISSIDGSTFLESADGYHDFIERGTLDYRNHNGGFQYIGGANWQISDNHSLGFKLGHDHNTIGSSRLLMDTDVILDGVLADRSSAVSDAESPASTQWTGNLYYDGTVGRLGINFNADFVDGRSESFTDTHEQSLISPADLTSESKSRTSMGAGKLILSHPIGKGTIKFGAEETYVAAAQTYSITKADIPATDASLTENTIAGFAEYAVLLPVGQLSAGLRYEHAAFSYRDRLSIASDLDRTDDSWFPSFNFATMAGPVGISLSYTGKTQRPNYGMLTTEMSYNNRYCYQTGDPKLLNQKRRTAALSANWKWLTFSGNYERVDNFFVQWATPYNDDGVVLIKNANLDVPLRRLNCYLIASPTVGVWSPMYTVGVQKQLLSLVVDDPRAEGGSRTVDCSRPMYLMQLNNAFRFRHSWVLNADYYRYSRMHTSISEVYRPIQCATLSIQKSFLKDDALTFNLTWADIFNTSMIYARTDYGRYLIDQPNDNFNTYLTLRVSYRFNSAGSKYKGTGAGQDAKNRM